MATQKHKAVSTITVTGITLPIVSAPIGPGESGETTRIGAFGDKRYTKVPNGISELKDIVITALYEGAPLAVLVNDVISVTITPAFSNGSGDPTTQPFTFDATLADIDYPTVEVDGDRKPAVAFTLTPIGGTDPVRPSSNQSNT